jgi:high potential iron-sulfur protein
MDRPEALRIVSEATEAAHTVLKKQAASVVKQFRAATKLAKAHDPDDDDDDLDDAAAIEFDLADLTDLAEGEFASYLSDMGESSAQALLAQVGLDEDDAITGRVSSGAVAAAREQAADLVSQIDDSTRDMLRDVIADGLEQNVGLSGIIDMIQNSAAFSEERATLIAQTEVRNANERGVLNGLKEARDSGNHVMKEWLADPDACEICLDNEDDGPIELDDVFSSGDSEPTAHPNCSCSISGVIEDTGKLAFVNEEAREASVRDHVSSMKKAETFTKRKQVSMESVGYVDTSPYDDKQCQNCVMFHPGPKGKTLGTCDLVKGEPDPNDPSINPKGWCTKWYLEG